MAHLTSVPRRYVLPSLLPQITAVIYSTSLVNVYHCEACVIGDNEREMIIRSNATHTLQP